MMIQELSIVRKNSNCQPHSQEFLAEGLEDWLAVAHDTNEETN
jgi:hypothetical protein